VELKVKIRSLKIYLDTIWALISEDCLDPKFIENVKLICQCALLGCSRYNEEVEMRLPFFIRSNWVYILMWISKDVITSQNSRTMANAVRAIEIKVLEILNKLTSYRLNMQVY
jgi:hypothetical protein